MATLCVSSVGAAGAGSCVASHFTASHVALRKSRIVHQTTTRWRKKLLNLQYSASSSLSLLLYCIPPLTDSAHAVDAIASPFWILEIQKCCHNKYATYSVQYHAEEVYALAKVGFADGSCDGAPQTHVFPVFAVAKKR